MCKISQMLLQNFNLARLHWLDSTALLPGMLTRGVCVVFRVCSATLKITSRSRLWSWYRCKLWSVSSFLWRCHLDYLWWNSFNSDRRCACLRRERKLNFVVHYIIVRRCGSVAGIIRAIWWEILCLLSQLLSQYLNLAKLHWQICVMCARDCNLNHDRGASLGVRRCQWCIHTQTHTHTHTCAKPSNGKL